MVKLVWSFLQVLTLNCLFTHYARGLNLIVQPCIGGPSVRGVASFETGKNPSCCDPNGNCYSTPSGLSLKDINEIKLNGSLIWGYNGGQLHRGKREAYPSKVDNECSGCFPDEISACRSNVTLLFPLSAVSVDRKIRVGIVQVPPLFVQPVIFNGCIDTKCRILGGTCNQIFVPQAMHTIKKVKGVDTTSFEFVYIEHGCECRPSLPANLAEEKQTIDENLSKFVRNLWNVAHNNTKNFVVANGTPDGFSPNLKHSALNWTSTNETKCGESGTASSTASPCGPSTRSAGELSTTDELKVEVPAQPSQAEDRTKSENELSELSNLNSETSDYEAKFENMIKNDETELSVFDTLSQEEQNSSEVVIRYDVLEQPSSTVSTQPDPDYPSLVLKQWNIETLTSTTTNTATNQQLHLSPSTKPLLYLQNTTQVPSEQPSTETVTASPPTTTWRSTQKKHMIITIPDTLEEEDNWRMTTRPRTTTPLKPERGEVYSVTPPPVLWSTPSTEVSTRAPLISRRQPPKVLAMPLPDLPPEGGGVFKPQEGRFDPVKFLLKKKRT